MRKYIATVILAGGAVVALWLGVSGDAPNRVATCPVSISDTGLALALDAGLDLKRNELLRFPVVRTALADGGLRFDLPPEMDDVRGLVRVKDWNDCVIEPIATYPNLATRWNTQFPFTFPGATSRRCVRAKLPGLPCLRLNVLLDGGTASFGDRNVFPRSQAVNPATCEPCECSITLGENPETDL